MSQRAQHACSVGDSHQFFCNAPSRSQHQLDLGMRMWESWHVRASSVLPAQASPGGPEGPGGPGGPTDPVSP